MSKEKEKRKRALQNAIASVEMEGYTVSDYEKKLCMDVLTDKITKEDLIAQMLERCRLNHKNI